MSTLIYDRLFTGVEFAQTFKILRPTNVSHIRPHVYLQGTLADGDFQIEILDGATVLETKTLSAAQINAVKTETYAHGFIRFDFDSLSLQIPEGSTEKEYICRFKMINHTTDSSNFLAINRNWDLKIIPTYGTGVVAGQASNDMIEPGGLEIYEYRN